MGGGVIPPNLVDAPPPPVQLLPHFPPGVRPLPQKTHPQQKKIFLWGGVTHPKQTQKSRNRFPRSGIRPFGRFPPNPHIGGEGEVGLPLHPPFLLGDGDLPVPSRTPHPAGLIPRLLDRHDAPSGSLFSPSSSTRAAGGLAITPCDNPAITS